MACVIVVGAQWGDEGKGKVVDLYTEFADVVVRFQGGAAPAAPGDDGEGAPHEQTLIPCSAGRRGKRSVIGPGAVVDLAQLVRELRSLRAEGHCADAQELLLSEAAHLVLPYHHALEAMLGRAGGARFTPGGRGYAAACEDRAARVGIRVGDLFRPAALRFKLSRNVKSAALRLSANGAEPIAMEAVWALLLEAGEVLRPFVGDVPKALDELRRRGKHLLFEGSFGALLDIDYGPYPFVAPVTTVAGGACVGGGMGPTHITAVVGVSKAYCTRIGDGPFPTEVHGELGARLCEADAAVPTLRRGGWLDVVALRHAARVCGMTGLAFTRLDALVGIPRLKLCVAYDLDGERIEDLPLDAGELDRCEPIYEEHDGWSEPLSNARKLEHLPRNARQYLARVSQLCGLPILLASVGAERAETLLVQNPFSPISARF